MEKAWNRKELKEKSKLAFRMQYWRLVLVAFVVSILCSSSFVTDNVPSLFGDHTSGFFKMHTDDNAFSCGDNEEEDEQIAVKLKEQGKMMKSMPIMAISFLAVIFIGLLVAAFTILITVLVCNPFVVGAARYMCQSFEKKPKLKELFFGFENAYRNVVNVMFLRSLYTFLWSLLFVIPGIIKKYEYRMVPYLLAQNPEMDAKEALFVSSNIMRGQKWKTFLLDLSFIGWQFLNVLTLGMVGTFYASPYIHLTNAALYRKLTGMDEQLGNIYISY